VLIKLPTSMIHSIKEILAIDPYILNLRFDLNEIR